MSADLPAPSPRIVGIVPYHVPRHGAPMDLLLDGIGGLPTPEGFFDDLAELPQPHAERMIRHYPDVRALHELLARRHGVSPDQVIITAGGDDALDRACRSLLAPGRSIVLPVPTFEMIPRYARWAEGTIREVPWPGGPYPTDAVIAAVDATTTLVAVVSPNNPTGATISADELRRLSAAAPNAVLLVDLAYVEFADEDLTPVALGLPNAVAFRTASKAWGLAGLRVGWALGPAPVIGWMRAAGNPYTVTGPSAFLTAHRIAHGEAESARYVATVRAQRDSLRDQLRDLGVDAQPSQANFVFARTGDADRALWIRDGMAGLGIGVRAWPGHPSLGDAVRVNVPGDEAALARLRHAFASVLAPEAVLLDMDGVIADVSRSYRRAIVETVTSFGAPCTPDDVRAVKALGDANNDWVVSHRLLRRAGVEASLDEVTARFEDLYQGTGSRPGLKLTETNLLPEAMLRALAARFPIAIVTGRPRRDAHEFLDRHGLAEHVSTVVVMEDGPCKPDPFPVAEALRRLGVTRAWMVGDTVDDVRAARAAGCVPVGIVAPGEDPRRAHDVLTAAGAARVLASVTELPELLP